MKKTNSTISNPDELNKYLQHSSIVTWLILGLVSVILVGLFVWASIYKLKIKLTGKAIITDEIATLNVSESDLSKLKEGQIVYISGKEGLLSFDNSGKPISQFELADGEYTYSIILKEVKPINFLINK
jgi:hypothetical protein